MKEEKGEMVQKASAVGSSRGGAGGGESCSICLEPISEEGFLDQCFHKFCYHCILQWSEMVISRPSSTSNPLQYLECPLCKTQYTSIIHDVFGAKFQRHYILTSRVPGLLKSEAHIRRQTVYSAHTGHVVQPPRLTHVAPKPNRWISCWVQRELQALMQEEDVDTVMHHVIGIVESFSKRSRGKVGLSGKQGTRVEDFDWHATISAAVRPFIFECAERFAVELESFLLSGLDIAAYDQKCKLAASAPEPATHADEEITIPPLNKDYQNTYDLFDEDVDEEFGHVMVRKASSEVDRYSSEERSETMKLYTPEEVEGIQELKSSPREYAVTRKTKKDSIRDSVKDSNLDRGRSKHRSKLHKKRKRQSSSSPISSPSRHKRRKREKSLKSRKKRKQTKRKERKALQEDRRKSHKRRSRKRNYTSSDGSSDSESSRNSRSVSPAERSIRLKARKEDPTLVDKAVSKKGDSRQVQGRDAEQRTRDRKTGHRGKSHHHRSNSFERGERAETDQFYEPSPDNSGRHRQPRLSDRGGQEFEVKDKYAIDADERSLTRSPEARPSRRRPSASTSPNTSVGRRSLDAHEYSCTPRKARSDEQAVRRLPLSGMSAEKLDVEEDARALESDLRGRALANLMSHLNEKEKFTRYAPVGNLGETSAIPDSSVGNP